MPEITLFDKVINLIYGYQAQDYPMDDLIILVHPKDLFEISSREPYPYRTPTLSGPMVFMGLNMFSDMHVCPGVPLVINKELYPETKTVILKGPFESSPWREESYVQSWETSSTKDPVPEHDPVEDLLVFDLSPD